MRRFRFVPALLSILLLVACTQKESSQASSDSNQTHATILLRNGTNVMGTVTSSTPSEITLNLDGGGSRTILTKDVRSVEYGEAAPGGRVGAQPANESARNSRPTEFFLSHTNRGRESPGSSFKTANPFFPNP